MNVLRRTVPVVLTAILLPVCAWPAADAPDADGAAESARAAHVREVMRSLHWVKGPSTVEVAANATLKVPEGYVFLVPQDVKKFQEVMENPSDGNEYLVAPLDLHWFALLSYTATGFVKDDEKVDADAVLKSISDGTEGGNEERKRRGWPAMHVKGWRYPPAYDAETKRLEWAIDGQAEGGGVATNFMTKVLGREGVTSAVLVTDPESLGVAKVEFKQTLTGYAYKDGHRYAEFRPGDKVAEYGLAGLIAGGAVAVAAKTGLLKGLWKFLVAGAAAGLAALRKLFGRRKEEAA